MRNQKSRLQLYLNDVRSKNHLINKLFGTIRPTKRKFKAPPLPHLNGILNNIKISVPSGAKFYKGQYDFVEFVTCKDTSRLYNDYSIDKEMIGMLFLLADTKGICPRASNCKSICFGTFTGNQKIPENRKLMTGLYTDLKTRPIFMYSVITEILRIIVLAHSNELKPVIRLNGYSDIKWETEQIDLMNIQDYLLKQCKKYAFLKTYIKTSYFNKKVLASVTIFELFHNIDFYDYTKFSLKERNVKHISNYHLTYSYDNSSLQSNNGFDIEDILENGENVAIIVDSNFKSKIFTDKKRYGWIELNKIKFGSNTKVNAINNKKYLIVDGDLYDNRKKDPKDIKGILIALEIDKSNKNSRNEAICTII